MSANHEPNAHATAWACLAPAQRRARIEAYLDGELDPAEAQGVLAGAMSSPACLLELEAARRLHDLLGTYPEPVVPPHFADGVLAAARAEPAAARPGRARLLFLRAAPLAAAAALLLAMGVWIGGRGREGTDVETTASTEVASLAALAELPSAALVDDAVLDLLMAADDETFEAYLAGEFDDLVDDFG